MYLLIAYKKVTIYSINQVINSSAKTFLTSTLLTPHTGGGILAPGRIILVQPNGSRIFIDCANLPTQGGPAEDLIIQNVQRVQGPHYEYLLIPEGPGGPETPDDIIINLNNDVSHGTPPNAGSVDLPYNGGPINTMCIKID